MISVPKSSNILDIISYGSTDKIDHIMPVSLRTKNDRNIEEKRSILKSKAYAGLFQFSEEYEYDAERLNEYKKFEEDAKNFIRRRYSVIDCNSTNLSSKLELNKEQDRRRSVCTYVIPNWTVSPPEESLQLQDENSNKELIIKSEDTIIKTSKISTQCWNQDATNNDNFAQTDKNTNKSNIEMSKNKTIQSDNDEGLNFFFHCLQPSTISPQLTNLLETALLNDNLKNSFKKSSDTSDFCFSIPSSSLSLLPDNTNKLRKDYSSRSKSCFASTLSRSFDLDSKECDQKSKNKATRRTSVTFGDVKEFHNNFVRTVRISSIEEGNSDDEKNYIDFSKESDIFEKVNASIPDKYIKSQKLKQRAKSLCTVPENQEYWEFLNLSEKNKASNSKNNHSAYSGLFYNIRSDSVDSGFSCASTSSYSSSEEATATTKRRTRSASIAVEIERTSTLTDTTDFSLWLKSVKKLVELTKELKNLTIDDESKLSTIALEEIANQNIEVENVNIKLLKF